MTKVLVLGSTGMLGHMVHKALARDPALRVDGTARGNEPRKLAWDVAQGKIGLRALSERHGPYAYIINCVGVTKAKINPEDERTVREAIAVNALFPHDVAMFAQEVGARVIHVSTDGVFSGLAASYPEDARHDCADVYGRTKSLGEVSTRGVLTFRCSIIGPDPRKKSGLLEWFLAQPDGKEVTGYADHWWNGVTTLQFAELCHKIVTQDRFDELWDESPVHHFCPNRPVSKYELLKIVQSVYKKDLVVTPTPGPQPPTRMILVTKYRSVARLFGRDFSVEQAVRALAEQA